jgi:tetratricopeptide (TPR) repeat protein/GT2 family glycosyltransferase
MQSTVNSTDTTAVHFNQRAEVYFSQGKLEDAIIAIDQALKLQPDYAPAYKTLGNIFQAQGRVDEALQLYAKALEIDPQFAEVFANLGSISASQQNWEDAIRYYEKAIAIKPTFSGVYRNLARLFSQLGKEEEATLNWYQAYTLEPDKATAEEHFNLGNTLLTQEKFDIAITCFRRALQYKPDLAAAYQGIGEALKRQGKLDEAAGYYRKAIEIHGNGNQGEDTLAGVTATKTFVSKDTLTVPQNQTQTTTPPVVRPNVTVTAPPQPPQPPEDPEVYLILGKGYFEQGKFDKAIASLQKAIAIKPDAGAYKLLGNALQALGKNDDAFKCYHRAVELNPNFAEALANLGSMYAQQQHWQQAINCYQRAIAAKPDFAGAYRNFAKLWTQIGKSEESAECWYRAIQLDPNTASADDLFSLAHTLLNQGKIDQAIGCFRRALELNPTSGDWHHQFAEVLKDHGRLTDAVQEYRNAIAHNPNNCWSHNNLAETLVKLERWEDAINAFRNAIKLNPEHSWAHNNLGDVLVKLERWEEAVDAYKEANKLNSDFFWSFNNLGDCLMKLERWEEAAEAYNRGNQINRDFVWSFNNLGDALFKLERWEEAAAAYQRALELNPSLAWAANNLGQALVKLERWEDAVIAYRRVSELNPDFPWAYYQLGEASAQKEEWDDAISFYRKAMEIKPDLPWISVKLGDCLRQRAKVDLGDAGDLYRHAIEENPEDIQLYHKALEIRPNDAELYLQLGNALVRKGWPDGAIVFYQMGLQIEPNESELTKQLEQVLEKKKPFIPLSKQEVVDQGTPTQIVAKSSASEFHKLGEKLQGEGKVDDAIEAYKKAITINQNHFGSYHNLGDLYQQKGKLEEAITSYRRAIELNPSFAWSHNNLGDTLLRQEKVDEAAVAYRKAIEIDTNFAWANYNLGRVLNQQDKLYEALGYYQRANELDPNLFPLDLQILREGLLQSQDVYSRWRAKNCPRESDLRQMARTVELFNYKPLISVIVPVYNTPEKFLRDAIDSVLNQVYPHWELCIADDASKSSHVKEILEEYVAKDSRIKVVYRTQNGHISQASNSALEIATGEFIALLDHDDLLTRDALYEVVLMLNRHPEVDMIYSDEDKVDANGELSNPYFKPDWSPESFLTRMYTCHLGTYRKSIIEEIGGFRVGFEGSQDYDLVLRFTEKTEKIYHIPKILYHWRIHSGSTAMAGSQAKLYAYEAAIKAITEATERRNQPVASVSEIPNVAGSYLVRYKILEHKRVSIIIPTRDLGDILDQCLTSIFEKTTYPDYEVIIVDNGSREESTFKILEKWAKQEPRRFKCCPLDIPFNFSKINNYGVTQATGDYFLLLNNDTEVITADWLEAMVELVQYPAIGAVGPLLLYPDNTVQHAGVVMGIGGVASHVFCQLPVSVYGTGYFNNGIGANNVMAVTGACLMCRREVFEQVGGLDEQLEVAYNDIDLCLKITEAGYRNLYIPYVKLYHYESKSRGYEDTPEKQARFEKESKIMESRWQRYIDNDPYYNPNLTRTALNFGLNLQD